MPKGELNHSLAQQQQSLHFNTSSADMSNLQQAFIHNAGQHQLQQH
jgi:hypothetical protein